ncbi:MAG: MarR family transcriptional regulator [Armatimonadetes bacterium]|nr:MarR family transcriptional regulator [Armatimonadota bacterium]
MSKKNEILKQEQAVQEAQEIFIREWGRMSSSWGINRTMAQIHALLFATGVPMSMQQICERLQISRGNASMSLRSLMDWGVVRRSRRPGERHDVYESDTDAVAMVARVVRERKRREIDPTADVLRTCLETLPKSPKEPSVRTFRRRVEGLLDVFDMMDMAFRFSMSTDGRFRFIVKQRQRIRALVEGFARKDREKP